MTAKGCPLVQNYEHAAGVLPSIESAVAIFEGEWSSAFPPSAVERRRWPGPARLFEDPRIEWILDRLGSLAGRRVLELGPLEGGHTYMLDHAGAEVVAIESNMHAYLKCLIAKELFQFQPATRILHGDFMTYMEDAVSRHATFDVVLASGVLYHVRDPLRCLELIADLADCVYVWTHYFEPDPERWAPSIRERLRDKWSPEDVGLKSKRLEARARKQHYLEARAWSGFSGGSADYSYWLLREDLLGAFRALGFDDLEVAHDQPDHPNGPSFSVLARRSRAGAQRVPGRS